MPTPESLPLRGALRQKSRSKVLALLQAIEIAPQGLDCFPELLNLIPELIDLYRDTSLARRLNRPA